MGAANSTLRIVNLNKLLQFKQLDRNFTKKNLAGTLKMRNKNK